uniref:Ig-like V-type domain-containing protein FAM187A isoform X2 n=1 Tax=Styela clava TaxID=7725 RepID=UPI0019393F31|nr:Ig-like V-type domain-containing protein FAM187A isoform X2 [Styela clava]
MIVTGYQVYSRTQSKPVRNPGFSKCSGSIWRQSPVPVAIRPSAPYILKLKEIILDHKYILTFLWRPREYQYPKIGRLVQDNYGKFEKEPPPWIPIGEDTQIKLLDRIVGEELYYTCHLKLIAEFKFESYGRVPVMKILSDATDHRITLFRKFDHHIWRIVELKTTDSGVYGCVTNNATNQYVLKVAVHDPKLFLWTLSERGMTPTRYIELGRTRAILKWDEWMPCDGCAGTGERRRFGFCYVKTRTRLIHCIDSGNIKTPMRELAERKRNEILVETCYDECDEDDDIFKPMSRLSLLVENTDSLELRCPGNITMRTSIKWELQFSTILRKDYSFGYGPAKEYYITRTNGLQINHINFRDQRRIFLACVVWRQERHTFELTLLPETDKIAETIEHIRMMAVSCSIQFALFLVIVLVIDSMKAFSESVSLNRNL